VSSNLTRNDSTQTSETGLVSCCLLVTSPSVACNKKEGMYGRSEHL
jgi:hypothetical protein